MNGGKLPEGWAKSTINEMCNLNPKLKLDDDLDVGFMPMAGVPTSYLGKCNFETKKWSEVKKGFTQFQNDDVIFAKITPCFENGKAVVIKEFPNGYGAGSTEYYVLRSINGLINPHWLFALVKTKHFLTNGALNMSGSVGHKRVTKEFVEKYCFPVPPLAEQKIIAEKLDTLLAQVDSTKARFEQIPQILKRFRQAVLGGAVNGKLTEKWRNFEPQHSVFKKLNFESILTELRNGLSSKPNESGVGHPILRISSVRAGHVDQNDIRFLECSESELNRHKLQDGDLLFTRYNGSLEFVGVCGLLKKLQHQNLLYPDKLIRARLTKDALPEYIEIFFSSPSARNAMMNCVKTTSGQKGISGKDIKSQVVLLPPVKEQAEIVRRVEQLFAYADTIEKQVNSALTRVNNLTQSILAKAFRGELTAQWRAENPDLISGENSAAALLEKIKAERAASGGKKTSRKKA